jgi:O-antigen/teichoic acid export membrane protein
MRTQATWVVGWRIVGILATVGGNIVAARLLGPAEYGRYLFLSSVAICGSMLGGAGLADAVLRFTGENLALGRRGLALAYVRRTAQFGLVTTLFSIGVTTAALLILQRTTGNLSHPALMMVLTAVTLAALAWQQMSSETLRGWNQLKQASLFSGGITGGPISTLLFLGGVLGLWLAGIELNAAGALALFATSVAVTVPFALWCVWRTTHAGAPRGAREVVRLSSSESRRMLAMASTILALTLLGFVSEQLDIWIGKVLLPADDLGVYGVAKRCLLLVAMPVQMAMLATIGAIPRFYAQQRRGELQNLLRTATTLAAIPSLGAISLLVLFPHEALQLLFGSSYGQAAPMIRILSVGYLALVLVGTPVNMLTLTGHHRTALVINVVSTALMIVLGPLAAAQFGVIGLAWTAAAALFAQCALQWWFAYELTGVWTHVGLPRREVLAELPVLRRLVRPREEESPEATTIATSANGRAARRGTKELAADPGVVEPVREKKRASRVAVTELA